MSLFPQQSDPEPMPEGIASKAALSHAEDIDLVRRILAGDEAAVARFDREYRPTLERLLMARGVERGQAEDLVADIVAECFGAGKKGALDTRLLEKFEGRSSLSTWLIRITWNRWLDLKRREKFRGALPEYEEDAHKGDPFDRLAPDDDPEDDLLETDLAELMGSAIKAAFDSLEPDALLMLKLSYLHGISQTAIARMWNCDQTRVSRTLTAARGQIATETMRVLRTKEPGLDLDWQDFKRLCAFGIEF